jgi:hypothetical protein
MVQAATRLCSTHQPTQGMVGVVDNPRLLLLLDNRKKKTHHHHRACTPPKPSPDNRATASEFLLPFWNFTGSSELAGIRFLAVLLVCSITFQTIIPN